MLNLDSVYVYDHQRTVPGYAGVRGSATNNATVTVTGNAAWRLGEYFYGGDEAANAASSVMKELDITAVYNPPGTNDPDVVTSQTGRVFVAKTPEAFQYDSDGNLTQDCRFEYTWNGENRLVCAEEQVCPTNRTLRKVDYAYDHQGRMVWKEIKHRDEEAQSWEEDKATSYLWDGYNIIAETTVSDSATNTTYNIWGLDLDGTMQGAGGVGGLLAVVKDSDTYIPTWDGNGNIMEYVSDDGSIVAHREYDPFGGTVVYTEQSAITNQQSSISFTHWFSTKPWCAVTGLSEYQFRKYDPVLGRWLNRDPIGEEGGLNLFLFCNNNAVVYCDLTGELTWLISGSLSVAFGYGFALLTDTPYDYKDAAIDFALGALGPGVISGAKKLASAGKCFKYSASISSKIVRTAKEVHKINDLGTIYGVATQVQTQRALSISWRIAGENLAEEGRVIIWDAVSVTITKKLLHGVNHASISEESSASMQYETDGNGNYTLETSESGPTVEFDNWDIEHVDGSLLNME